MYMKNKKLLVSALLGVSTLAIGAVVGIAAGKKSGFRAYADPVEPEWHHYHAQNPSLNWQNKATNKGTKEYWVQCGGGHQFTVPDSDNKVYETGAPDTSEFAADDDRWVTYCELNGHNYDSKGVCEYCNELQYGSKLIDKAIANTTISDEAAPLGFTSVYTRNGMSSGPCGYSYDVSGCDVLYFSLYSTASTTIAFGGNNGVNPVLFSNDWYNILLTKDENGWVANYKKAYEVNWNTDHTKVDENKATDFATILRLYNWDGALSTATIKCTEVQTALPPHVHTVGTYGFCSSCGELIGKTKVADKAIAAGSETTDLAPAGFEKVYSATGLSNGNNGSSFLVAGYKTLYFSIWHNISYIYLFGGNNAENATAWQGDWYNILLLNDGSGFICYFKKASETTWTTDKPKVDGKNDTNFSSILRLYNWSDLGSATVKCTEVYGVLA